MIGYEANFEKVPRFGDPDKRENDLITKINTLEVFQIEFLAVF